MSVGLIHGDRARTGTTNVLGRYRVHEAIAVGQVTSVHVGVVEGASGFRKPVALKRLLARFVYDREENARLSYEASVLAHIHHPNVVPVLDVMEASGELFVAMEHVLGETIAGLAKSRVRASVSVAVAIAIGALRGLAAAHAACGAAGQPLRVVHRDVCPDNLLIGVDGIVRVVDFGAAQSTLGSRALLREVSPNVGYAAPEQLMQQPLDARADIFAMGVVLWEMLTGKRLFRSAAARDSFLEGGGWSLVPPSAFNADVPRVLDDVVRRALGWLPEERFDSATSFATALERVGSPADPARVAEFVENNAAAVLRARRAVLAAMEGHPGQIADPTQSAAEPFDDATTLFVPERAVVALPRAIRPSRSTLLTAIAAALLLLAGARLSRGTLPPTDSGEVARVGATTRTASASMDVEPLDVSPQLGEARPLPRREATETEPRAERDRRPRVAAKAVAGVPDKTSCDPPFVIDGSGIKRMKPNCL